MIVAILLGAHVDAAKGLFKATRNWGQQRFAVFTNPALYGLEFINPRQRDIIQNVLKEREFARDTRMSFVQSSDFHGSAAQTIGSRRTYVRFDNVKRTPPDVFDAPSWEE